jgi:hypothetical protein
VLAGLSFFDARDDSTTTAPAGPGTAVPAQSGELGARLRAGNVQLSYGDEAGRAAAARLARDIAGAPSPQLAAAGQAVVIAREPGLRGLRALAWRRELRAADPGDPAVRAFVEHWLGRGVHR